MNPDNPTDPPNTAGDQPQPRRLLRSREERVIAGVAAGLGRYLNVDPVIVRLALIVLALLGGAGIAAYLVAWVVVPVEGEDGKPHYVWGEPNLPRVLSWIGIGLAIVVGSVVLAVGSAIAAGLGSGAVVAGMVILIGALLAVSAVRGGMRWLAFPALVIAIPLGIVSAAGIKLDGGVGDRTIRPATLVGLPAQYRLGMGRLEVDLRDANWSHGQRVGLDVRLGLGQLVVVVPHGVCVDASTHVGAGYINVLGREDQGFDAGSQEPPAGAGTAPRLELHGDVGMGALQVVHDPAEADRSRNDAAPLGSDVQQTAADAVCAPTHSGVA
jgi:phage shock protein PspC (stress-responsive transcriptional regulator)